MFSHDEIISKMRTHEIQKVPMPEWGQGSCLHIRTMSGKQREETEELAGKGGKNLRTLVFVYSVCNEKGDLQFNKDDMPLLNEGNGKLLDRVFFAALKLNKMSEEDVEAAKKN